MEDSDFQSQIKQIFVGLGLSSLEIKLFLATLEMGAATASAIARRAHTNRITAYEVLKRLVDKGLVSTSSRRGTKIHYFEAEDIAAIQLKLEAKQKQIGETIAQLEGIKSDLRSLYEPRANKPTVLFYEGVEGLKTALYDTLKQKPREILSFASADALEKSYELPFLSDYWQKRTKMKISSRGILPKTERAVSIFTPERNQRELRQVRFIGVDVVFKNEIDIYGQNVSILSLEHGDEHGVIIRSKNIAESLRSVYDFLWNVLKKINN